MVIIRHPETNAIANTPGEQYAPSPKGIQQLLHAGKVCRREHVSAVVHSTLTCASTAAKELASELDVPKYARKGFNERDFGDWNREDWPLIQVKLKKLTIEDRYIFKPPNGESWQDLEKRLQHALKDIAKLEHDSVAVMTHAGCIRTIMALLGIKTKEETVKFIPVLGECFVVDYDPALI